MEFLYELGLFAAQTLLIVLGIVAIIMVIAANAGQKSKGTDEGFIEVRSINDRFDGYTAAIRELSDTDEVAKARAKLDKKAEKERAKADKARAKEVGKAADSASDIASERPRTFVLSFEGDMMASQVEALREEISAVLPNAQAGDEVLLRLESPGGVVHGYGLAASQLSRIREAGVTLVIAVDKVAASGGYMMACVGDRILAAPFAVLGSIGVVAQMPNFHRLLKKNDVDVEQFTAGEFKRTITMFAENTDKGRRKFESELEDTHGLFKQFVSDNRQGIDIEKISTGEVWYGQQAIDVGLIDEISTSDGYLQRLAKDRDLIEVRYKRKQKLAEKMGFAAEAAADRLFLRLWKRVNETRFL
ncbi:MAG: protease SohB [Pseudomonadota bacterium]|nr:protease SohB [Pseudomonadota bacterium]